MDATRYLAAAALAAWAKDRSVDTMLFSHSGALEGQQALQDHAASVE